MDFEILEQVAKRVVGKLLADWPESEFTQESRFYALIGAHDVMVADGVTWAKFRDMSGNTLSHNEAYALIAKIQEYYSRLTPEELMLYEEYLRQAKEREKAKNAAQPKPQADKSGFVYLIKSPTGAYKIGRTKDPDNRMGTFGVTLPFEVEYEHIIKTDDMVGLEKKLHSKYDHKRRAGEWFDLNNYDVAYIKAIGGDA